MINSFQRRLDRALGIRTGIERCIQITTSRVPLYAHPEALEQLAIHLKDVLGYQQEKIDKIKKEKHERRTRVRSHY